MREKDKTQKILESYNDVFSDIVNVLLFGGRSVISEDELEEQAPRAYYKAAGQLREMERDVAKRWKKGNIRVACVGLENQTDADADMPLRVIGYDGAEYRSQLLPDNKGKSRYPVVTLVLYFGYKKRWDKPLSLKQCLEIPKEFAEFVNDYKINLFEIAYLTRQQVALFKSDFRIVADYFVQMRESGDYIPNPQQIRHVQETMQLLSAMTRDDRFEEVCKEAAEGGLKNMCEVLDKIEDRGRKEGRMEGRMEGRREGRAEGELKGKMETAVNLHNMGMDMDFIAKAVNASLATVKQWLSQASV